MNIMRTLIILFITMTFGINAIATMPMPFNAENCADNCVHNNASRASFDLNSSDLSDTDDSHCKNMLGVSGEPNALLDHNSSTECDNCKCCDCSVSSAYNLLTSPLFIASIIRSDNMLALHIGRFLNLPSSIDNPPKYIG